MIPAIERIGSKTQWQKDSDVARLAEELTHLLNNAVALANHFHIDLEETYQRKSR